MHLCHSLEPGSTWIWWPAALGGRSTADSWAMTVSCNFKAATVSTCTTREATCGWFPMCKDLINKKLLDLFGRIWLNCHFSAFQGFHRTVQWKILESLSIRPREWNPKRLPENVQELLKARNSSGSILGQCLWHSLIWQFVDLAKNLRFHEKALINFYEFIWYGKMSWKMSCL